MFNDTSNTTIQQELADAAQAQGIEIKQLLEEIITIIHESSLDTNELATELSVLIDQLFLSHILQAKGVKSGQVKPFIDTAIKKENGVKSLLQSISEDEFIKALRFAITEVLQSYFSAVPGDITPEKRQKIATVLQKKLKDVEKED